MNKEYGVFVVLDGKEIQVERVEAFTKQEAKDTAERFRNLTNIDFTSADGVIYCIPEAKMKDVYIIFKEI